MGSDDAFQARTRFKKRAAALLDANEDITSIELISRLSFYPLDRYDTYPDWHPSKPFEPMIRALFLKEFHQESTSWTARQLEENRIAERFGFDIPPHRSTLDRTWTNRFSDDLRLDIERKAKWVRAYSREIGHPLGADLKSDDGRGSSERTTYRVINEKLKEVPREIAQLVSSELDILPQRAQNAHYHPNAFIEAECTLGIERQAAETGCKNYNDYTERETGGPDADTLLHYIKQLSERDVLRMSHNSTGLLVNQAKSHLEFDRPVTVAIDITDIPYYGGEHDDLVIEARPEKDYRYCHQFAALSIVGENTKFFLAIRPVREGKSRGKIVEELVSDARHHVNIHTVYADREFASGRVCQSLDEENIEYVIPTRKNSRIKRAIDRMNQDVVVKQEYGIYGPTGEGPTNERVETNLVLAPSEKDPTSTIAFYTNKDVSDDNVSERQETKRLMNRYRDRWGIENSYKSVKTFLPWTTSNNYTIRLFHFAFSVALYNMWRLVDFLVKKSIPSAFSHKSVVRAKRFVGRMRVVYTL